VYWPNNHNANYIDSTGTKKKYTIIIIIIIIIKHYVYHKL